MIYDPSSTAIAIFSVFVAAVLGISFYLGRQAKSASGYFAAHGEIHWFVNGVAFAGDYLSAASFLGICGIIAFYGYDGFLYSIGFLAGWIVALFVVAEPLKRLGKFTFADALDYRFHSPTIKISAGISALVVSVFYLIPQMVGAGKLVQPLLGFPYMYGVLTVGITVVMIVVTAGMVSTTWVQFIKGAMLVVLCGILTVLILQRGFKVDGLPEATFGKIAEGEAVEPDGGWTKKPEYQRFRVAGPEGKPRVMVLRTTEVDGQKLQLACQTFSVTTDGKKFANGLPFGNKDGESELSPVGFVSQLPGGKTETGPLNPLTFLSTLQESQIVTWGSEEIVEADGSKTKVYFQKPTRGIDLIVPGGSPTFKSLRTGKWSDQADFLSLMLALFAGTASLPHILIRYYTVKDEAAARKSTVVGIASIGCFYVFTLYLGLGAMTSGKLDVTDSNMAAPLLARSFGEFLFAVISAVAFTTVLGTVSGLIMAASGAVVHDLIAHGLRIDLNDHAKVRIGKISAVVVGVLAMVLGILFEKLNPAFLVGWAFNVAASANLPALVMLLFWKKTTKAGVATAILVGLCSSLTWILLSAEAFDKVYGLKKEAAFMPFSQPGIVTIPLGFIVLIVVSLITQPRHESNSTSTAGA